MVFADVDPATFTLDPRRARAGHHAGHARRRADASLRAAVRHGRDHGDRGAPRPEGHRGLRARARRDLRRRPVGTFGDAGFFSFQTLKPLNCYGGGMALVRDRGGREPRPGAGRSTSRGPTQKRIDNRLLVGRLQRIFIKPWVFTISAFPILWVSSLIGANPDVYLWEKIRSLDPLPRRLHRALPERAGGDRAGGARPTRRLDRAHAASCAA